MESHLSSVSSAPSDSLSTSFKTLLTIALFHLMSISSADAQNKIRMILQVKESDKNIYTQEKISKIEDNITYYLNTTFENTNKHSIDPNQDNFTRDKEQDSIKIDIIDIVGLGDDNFDSQQSTAKRAERIAHTNDNYFDNAEPIKIYKNYGTPNSISIIPIEYIKTSNGVGSAATQQINGNRASSIVLSSHLIDASEAAKNSAHTFISHEMAHLLENNQNNESIHDTAYEGQLNGVDLNQDGKIELPYDIIQGSHSLGKGSGPYSYIMTKKTAENTIQGAQETTINYPDLQPLTTSYPETITNSDALLSLSLGDNWSAVHELQTTITYGGQTQQLTTSQTSQLDITIDHTLLSKGVDNPITYTITNPLSGENYTDTITIYRDFGSSIEELAAAGIDLYYDNQTLTVTTDQQPIDALQLYTIHGQQISSVAPQQQLTQMDISQVPQGMYIAMIQTAGRRISTKIIK